MIAAGTCVDGTLELSCNLHVEGEVKGQVSCLGTITIGKKGKASGEVKAGRMIVSGEFDGDCHSGSFEITKSGTAAGNVYAREMIIAKGGHFNGNCSDLGAESPFDVTELHPAPEEVAS
ncbi:bactofilin family protein [Echinimonas agarilytica]|uniref:Polymer-forming cytoskeletal protein n=1 Tax=Echinimonas agarilytica TaxID=1215918 RepID=A0AA41W822_9GAMM|nr:polymer-forming cytoskeletal protein [Echinimonas agarilytica]